MIMEKSKKNIMDFSDFLEEKKSSFPNENIIQGNPLKIISSILEDKNKKSIGFLPIKTPSICWWLLLAQNETMPKVIEKTSIYKTNKNSYSEIFTIGFNNPQNDSDKSLVVFHFSKAISKQDILSALHMLKIKAFKIYDMIAATNNSIIILAEVNENYETSKVLKDINEKIILEKSEIQISTIGIIGS